MVWAHGQYFDTRQKQPTYEQIPVHRVGSPDSVRVKVKQVGTVSLVPHESVHDVDMHRARGLKLRG